MLDDEFPLQTKIDLYDAEAALRAVRGLTWHISLSELMEAFIRGCRGNQLLIVQPTIVAMVYAINAKPSCYNGFWQLAQPGRRFKYVDFIAE